MSGRSDVQGMPEQTVARPSSAVIAPPAQASRIFLLPTLAALALGLVVGLMLGSAGSSSPASTSDPAPVAPTAPTAASVAQTAATAPTG
jgi:hypothetical protein